MSLGQHGGAQNVDSLPSTAGVILKGSDQFRKQSILGASRLCHLDPYRGLDLRLPSEVRYDFKASVLIG